MQQNEKPTYFRVNKTIFADENLFFIRWILWKIKIHFRVLHFNDTINVWFVSRAIHAESNTKCRFRLNLEIWRYYEEKKENSNDCCLSSIQGETKFEIKKKLYRNDSKMVKKFDKSYLYVFSISLLCYYCSSYSILASYSLKALGILAQFWFMCRYSSGK